MSSLKHVSHIPLCGTPNFRDFGGHSTRCGARVKRRLLFRSGHLAELTDADLALVEDLGIGLVFDFRRDEERAVQPSLFPEAARPDVVHLPIDPGRTLNLNVLEIVGNRSIDVADVVEFMCNVNRELVLGYSGQYRRMFEHMLNNDSAPSLIHCSAGKDRTGFAAALILSALNVAEADILDDYLLSGEFFDVEHELLGFCRRLNWQLDSHILRPVMEVRKEYLGSAFDAIHERYAELNDYLAEELGVDEPARQELRARYLEPAAAQ